MSACVSVCAYVGMFVCMHLCACVCIHLLRSPNQFVSLKLEKGIFLTAGFGKQTGEKDTAEKNKTLIRSIILDSLSYLNGF